MRRVVHWGLWFVLTALLAVAAIVFLISTGIATDLDTGLPWMLFSAAVLVAALVAMNALYWRTTQRVR